MSDTPEQGDDVTEADTEARDGGTDDLADGDVEFRGQAADRTERDPAAGATYLATDTGVVYVGDGDQWLPTLATVRYGDAEGDDPGSLALGDPANSTGSGAAGATVAGGGDNVARGDYATVSGGRDNAATGDYSIALGRGATAAHDGAFVVGDSTDVPVGSVTSDEVRFQGTVCGPLFRTTSSYSFVADEGDLQAWMTWNPGPDNGWTIQRNGDDTALPETMLRVTPSGDTVVSGDLQVAGDLDVRRVRLVREIDADDGPTTARFSAVEAGTPRTETAGVAALEAGRAEIDLPAQFGRVTCDDDPLIVQTTPYGGDGGLRVAERSTDRIVVEDVDGEGEYEFAYTVKGTREGDDDERTARDATASTASTDRPSSTTDDER